MQALPRFPFALDPLIAEAKRRTRRRRLLVALIAATVAGAALGTTLALQRPTTAGRSVQPEVMQHGVVLGSTNWAPMGSGWATARPRQIYNGGDGTGRAWHIAWKHWGSATATGVGRTRAFAAYNTRLPKVGPYYRRPMTIEFRATDLGRCGRRGPIAYRKLLARSQSYPGGPLSRWGNWSWTGNICTYR